MGYDYTFPRNQWALKAEYPSDLVVELGQASAAACTCLGGYGVLAEVGGAPIDGEALYGVQKTTAESVLATICVLEAVLRKLPQKVVADAESSCIEDMTDYHARIARDMDDDGEIRNRLKRELLEWLEEQE